MKKLLLFIPIALILAALSGCVGEDKVAERVIFTFGWDDSESYYCMRTYTLNGVFVSSFECEEHPEDTCMAVDEDDNVYYVDAAIGYNIIRKRDRDGTLLLSKATTYSTRLCMSPDGYVCELGLTTDFDLAIIRRDPDTLDVVDQMITADQDSGHYEGFTCDSEGYFYWIKRNTDLLEKWDFNSGIMVASHTVPWTGATRIAAVGNVVAFNAGNYVYTIPTSLDENATQHTLTDLSTPKAVASIENGSFLVGGYDSASGKYVVGKYTSGLAKVWATQDIPNEDNLYGVGAYPFAREEAPIIALIG